MFQALLYGPQFTDENTEAQRLTEVARGHMLSQDVSPGHSSSHQVIRPVTSTFSAALLGRGKVLEIREKISKQ